MIATSALIPYLGHARRWLLFAVLPALVAALAAYAITERQAKTYQASTTLYVQQSSYGGIGTSGLPDVYTSAQLATTRDELVAAVPAGGTSASHG